MRAKAKESMSRFTVFMFTSLALCAAATASAQEGGVTLRVDRGTVMTSQGGEFASARSGQSVVAGERLMITEGATATLTYPKGCARQFSAPGVYVISAACPTTTQGTDWAGAAKIVAGGVVMAAVLHDMDQTMASANGGRATAPSDDDSPPVSR